MKLTSLFLFLVIVFVSSEEVTPKRAFVSLLYGNSHNYTMMLRVMHKSWRKVREEMYTPPEPIDFVVLSINQSEAITSLFRKDGMKVIPVEPIPIPWKPGPLYRKVYEYVFTKLRIFELYQYEQVALVDNDMMVVRPIDGVFDQCKEEFCATGDSLTLINAGFMVARPSFVRFQSIMDDYAKQDVEFSLPEQEFLSNYISNAINGMSYQILEDVWNGCGGFNGSLRIYHQCGHDKFIRQPICRNLEKCSEWLLKWQYYYRLLNPCMIASTQATCEKLRPHGMPGRTCGWCENFCTVEPQLCEANAAEKYSKAWKYEFAKPNITENA